MVIYRQVSWDIDFAIYDFAVWSCSVSVVNIKKNESHACLISSLFFLKLYRLTLSIQSVISKIVLGAVIVW
jgi:hypothetical protein